MVRDGQIVRFAFPQHSWTFLALEGRFDGFEECLTEIEGTPLPESCARIQMENIDGWADWYQTLDASTLVEHAIASWFGGDCLTALVISIGDANNCSSSSDTSVDMIRYESILRAQVSVENCVMADGAPSVLVTCDLHYSNALNEAVGKAPAVSTKIFDVRLKSQVYGWYDSYPRDSEPSDSFQAFAEGGGLSTDYAAAGCDASPTPDCANDSGQPPRLGQLVPGQQLRREVMGTRKGRGPHRPLPFTVEQVFRLRRPARNRP